MSKEAAAAILVQTLFTSDKSMQNLVMSHAKVGTADPKDVVAFILPYYREMLRAMDSDEGEVKKAESGDGTEKSREQDDAKNDETENKGERGSAKKAGA